MKRKNLLALLLALTMTFALAACGSTSSESKEPAAYQGIIDAMEDFFYDPEDMRAMSDYLGGDFLGDEIYALVQMEIDNGLIDAADFAASFEDELSVEPGTELSIKIKKETTLDADDVAAYQSDLDDASAGIIDLADTLSTLQDELNELLAPLSEEELAEVYEEFEASMGMTFDDYMQLLRDMTDTIGALADKLKDAAIEEARTVTLSYDGGTEDIVFLKIDGKWATQYLIDMLDALQSEANAELSDLG